MTVNLPKDSLANVTTMPEGVGAQTSADVLWRTLLQARAGLMSAECAHVPVYGPLVADGPANRLVIGQFGQSLDGRIATPTGESKYLNGSGGLAHLHRIRALVDGVVVGASTVALDDPLLTVRMVQGPNPARIVIDPNGRVSPKARLFAEDGARRVVVTSTTSHVSLPDGVEIIRLDSVDGRLLPMAIVVALASIGLEQLLIEGGADTVSRFLQANCLDRLHVSVAPVLMGAGRSGLNLPECMSLADCLRPRMDVHRIGDDVLFDCEFERRAQT